MCKHNNIFSSGMKKFEKNYFNFYLACIASSLVFAFLSYYFFDRPEVFYFALSPIITLILEYTGKLINTTFRVLGFCLGMLTVQYLFHNEGGKILEVASAGHFIVLLTRSIFHVMYEKPNVFSLWLFRLIIITAPFTFFRMDEFLRFPLAVMLISVIMFLSFYGIEYMTHTLRYRIQKIREEQEALNDNMKLVKNLNSLISHNLRTPIANLLGQSQIAAIENPENTRIQSIQRSAESVMSQLNVFLEAKKTLVHSNSIAVFIEKWAKKYDRVKIIKRNCSIGMPNEEVLSVLYTVLCVFTDNSFEHGASEVIISLRGGELIHQDNGSGMNQDQLSKFGEALSSTKENHSGLGVHFSTLLLNQVNISWKVESDLGSGTKIVLNCSSM